MDLESIIKQFDEDIKTPSESLEKLKTQLLSFLDQSLIVNQTNQGLIAFKVGKYYEVEKDYEKMKYYYKVAIEKGNIDAMNNLGNYFQYNESEKNYEKMKYYYKLAIENGNSISMHNLGFYYQYIEKDYEKMKYYYKMAISKGNSEAMNNLGYYYKSVKKNYGKMKYYYEMAAEKGNDRAMNNLGYYYKNVEKDYEKMKYYYKMAISKGNSTAIKNLRNYYCNHFNIKKIEALKFFYKHNLMRDWVSSVKLQIEDCKDENTFNNLLDYLVNLDKKEWLIKLPYFLQKILETVRKKIDTLELHFKYAPSAEGFEEAKKDFLFYSENN